MLVAITLKSLPDSVYDYFHSHTHSSRFHHSSNEGDKLGDYTYTCHIQAWYYETYVAEENHFEISRPQQVPVYGEFRSHASEVKSIVSNGRSPPKA